MPNTRSYLVSKDLFLVKQTQDQTAEAPKVWFQEFNSLDENSLTLDVDGSKLECKAEMREVEIKI
jgi:hypothetical protein